MVHLLTRPTQTDDHSRCFNLLCLTLGHFTPEDTNNNNNNNNNNKRSGGGSSKRKRAKYAEIIQSHHFVPLAIETLGPINMDGERFLDSLGECLSSISGDPRETTFLYQRLYSSKFSMRLPFMVLSFSRQLPKVNSRTRF